MLFQKIEPWWLVPLSGPAAPRGNAFVATPLPGPVRQSDYRVHRRQTDTTMSCTLKQTRQLSTLFNYAREVTQLTGRLSHQEHVMTTGLLLCYSAHIKWMQCTVLLILQLSTSTHTATVWQTVTLHIVHHCRLQLWSLNISNIHCHCNSRSTARFTAFLHTF